MANVRLEGIKRRFNNITAIEDITFEVPDGQFWVLVGPSGCGKSTVAKYGGKSLDHSSSAKRGRPGKLTSRDKRALARMVANGGTKTAVEAAKTFNLERESFSDYCKACFERARSEGSQKGEETKALEGAQEGSTSVGLRTRKLDSRRLEKNCLV